MSNVQKIEAQQGQVQTADPMVSMIERVVMSADADLDKLERMLAMKERMDAQAASKAYAAALSEARSEIPPIIKDATVDFTSSKGRTSYKHETLAGIAKQIDPILSKHGLSYRFRTDQGNGGVKVTCIIQHRDGHSEETSLSGAPDGSGSKNGFQAVGSAVTYLQRYTLKAALGLSAEVDDDAQGAAPRGGQQPARQQRRNDGPDPEAVGAAKGSIEAAETMDQLQAIWTGLPTAIQNVPALVSAKNDRKKQLGKQNNEQQPTDRRGNEDLGGDEIPY